MYAIQTPINVCCCHIFSRNTPPLCTPYHEPIIGVIYHLSSQIIVEMSLCLCRPRYALLYQPYIEHIHHKNRQVEPLRQIFSTQLFFDVKTFLVAPIVPINLATRTLVQICCDWLCYDQLNQIRLCISSRILLTPLHASVRTPFLHLPPSKNEVLPVLIHPKKSPNTGFVLSTGLFNNPLTSPLLWKYMLDR